MSAQADFAGGLLNPDHPAPKGLSDGKGRAAGRRYDVYRNNVTTSLAEALATGFPAVTRLIGEENMKGLARMHLRASPPVSPVLAQYGEGFPKFLASVDALSPYPYLPDVARLELALRRAYHAADASPIAPELLASLPTEQLVAAQIGLAPAIGILRSAYPIHDIWTYTLQGGPKPGAGPQDVLVLRRGYDPLPVELPAGGFSFVTTLLTGQSFGVACDMAEAAHPGFEPTDTLTLLLTHDAITHIHGPDR
ncbi:DNA-binding domain-containing protein [Arenibacterium halophilum]|uniref:DUF2063 domain-containing protein n=1 Tax=Arenibacterium halophilum TaxID=2583821 RepID=A0ABY2XDV5_9RHOB|nr:DNA-binding domain-containing protein [Arenibacterium halophilum]TMV14838.1 DUF2063 domain-containing protein [Arenibacterium halophilum]